MPPTTKPMLVYIAGPYRGDVAGNISRARDVAIAVWRTGHYALCPHLNTAHFDDHCRELPDAVWLEGTMAMLERCDAMILVPGWEKSSGTRAELLRAEELGMPIYRFPKLPPRFWEARNAASE